MSGVSRCSIRYGSHEGTTLMQRAHGWRRKYGNSSVNLIQQTHIIHRMEELQEHYRGDATCKLQKGGGHGEIS